MKMQSIVKGVALLVVLGGANGYAQSINVWRGGADGGEWENQYKWNLSHTPTGQEAAHFRDNNTIITVNSTVQLNNGMHLYGQELLLQGTGNINLWSPISHERTVNIPASATGFANLTLSDTLSINGRIALSAKGFGTSASKGSITLEDRSNVSGGLCIGNAGNGTGQVFVKDSAVFRITEMEFSTKAESGGSAEIHAQGGTVHIETKTNPFDVFLEDPSRKLVISDGGTLRIDYNLPIARKKAMVMDLIKKDRLVAAPGSRLLLPSIHEKTMIIKAEDARNHSEYPTKQALLSAIDRISSTSINSSIAQTASQAQSLDALLKTVKTGGETGVSGAPGTTATTGEAAESGGKLAGYIAFVGALLLVLRRAPATEESADDKA